MKKRDKRQEEAGGLWLINMCEVLKGSALAGLVAVLSLLLCAVLVSAGIIPVDAMDGSVMAVCIVSAAVGSIYAIRRVKGGSLFVGLGVGGILFLLLITAGLLVYEEASVANGGVGILCACLCGGAIVGILGRKPKKKRRR